jgi:hypothetical protein
MKRTFSKPTFPISKLPLFLCLNVSRRSSLLTDGRGVWGDEMSVEPNHMTARKPGPLQIVQYSTLRINEATEQRRLSKSSETYRGARHPQLEFDLLAAAAHRVLLRPDDKGGKDRHGVIRILIK